MHRPDWLHGLYGEILSRGFFVLERPGRFGRRQGAFEWLAATSAASHGFPNDGNAGVPAGVSLTDYDGPTTITADGTVIDGKSIRGTLIIKAANVVIQNCRVSNVGFWGIDASEATNTTVKDCTIVGPGYDHHSDSAIVGSGTFLRNDISNFENGILLQPGGSVVKGNYIHDLAAAGADPHYDGIAVQGGQNGVLIEDNTVIGRDTSDVFIKNDFGPISNVTVHHNFLIGDPAYDIYVDGRADGGPITGVTITNNWLQKGVYGYLSIDNSSPHVSGNIDLTTGGEVRAP